VTRIFVRFARLNVLQAPQQMLAKAAFVKFQTTLIKVLGVFESQKLRHGRSGNGLTALGDGDGGAESYCVKYLTSSKLLHLQLRDPAFRRHFLLQVSVSENSEKLHHRVDAIGLPVVQKQEPGVRVRSELPRFQTCAVALA
jgi:hypothetical protein